METNRRSTKRTYHGLGEWFGDLAFMAKNLRALIRMSRKRTVRRDLRERLMLAVTSVYGCRYCTWVHTREALRSGVDPDEITVLLSGSVDSCPREEAVAVLYAQHWADADTRPDPEAFNRLVDTYGPEKAESINLVLRMIRIGNLMGNSWDSLLHRISFGRWGH